MEIVDPMAMTNAMTTGVMLYDGTAAWLTLLGLLVGSGAGLLFAGALPWRPRLARLPGLPRVGARPAVATE